MPSTVTQQTALKLSICITTFNRAAFIGATLDSILVQLTNDCEVVVLDGASTDETERVVSEYAFRFDRLRYVKQETNNGIDRDYDRAVELARGEYCWLMTDDDLLRPGAVAAVLHALRRNVSLIIVNVEARDLNMSKVLQHRWLNFESDRVYGVGEMDRLFLETGEVLKYIGCVVIKRAIWLERERERYYGWAFTYFAVIFQEPLPREALVIAEPFISYRWSNTHTFSQQLVEIVWVRWPSLVRSLALSDSVKSRDCIVEPWRSVQALLLFRGLGFYSLTEYRRWIRPQLRSMRETLTPVLVALAPGVLVNALLVFYYSVTRSTYQGWRQPALVLQDLRDSPFHLRNWRVFKRKP